MIKHKLRKLFIKLRCEFKGHHPYDGRLDLAMLDSDARACRLCGKVLNHMYQGRHPITKEYREGPETLEAMMSKNRCGGPYD